MKFIPKLLGIMIVLLCLLPLLSAYASAEAMTRINRWEIKWETDTEYSLMEAIDSKGYKQITPETLVRAKQAGAHGIWIKFVLPHISHREGLFINNLYGEHVTAYMDEQQIYQHSYNYLYGKNRLLLPIEVNDSDKTILIHVHSSMEEMGLLGTVQIGDYQQFTVSYVKEDLIDIILGCSFLIVATLMFICSIFLGRGQIAAWLSLSAVILSASILLLAYSPFLYTFYGNYGSVYLHLFDLALFTLMPSLTYFFESIFGKGLYSIIRRYRIFQVYYSSLCFFLLLLQNIVPIRGVYFFLTVTAFGITMIVQFMLLFIMSIIYAVRGNKDAVFISTGFGLFALIGTGELLWFYLDKGYYELHLWKYGLIGFICSLVILLGKRFAHSHMQIVKYSKELEMYNNRLQRSEKMEVISQLAASVAHEVRNPLQVTRGFLQLMGDFTNADKERKYLKLAIEELDRAANIITNYLTFAKPQLEEVCVLNLAEELLHVEGILLPLANQEGGKIVMNIPKDLHMRGNSSKLKQAFINIIKNSIEALQGSGSIHLWAYEEQGEAIIHIRDNGRGMEESTLKRLGEPYFSSQTKGTGLGLMVTFRIIELMEGKLEFKSNLGTGTEAIIRFPIVKQ